MQKTKPGRRIREWTSEGMTKFYEWVVCVSELINRTIFFPLCAEN